MMSHARITLSLALAACAHAPATAQWSSDPSQALVVAGAPGQQVQPKIVATDDGGCWITWFDNATGGYDVRIQKLDAGGHPTLAPGGLLVADRSFSSTVDYDLAADTQGNAYVTFRDDRGGGINITVNKISPGGELLWGENGFGVRLTNDSDTKNNPKVAPLPDGTVVVGWTHNAGFYVQRLDADGAPLWAGLGVNLSEAGRLYTLSDLVPSSDGAVMALWVRTTTTSFLSSKGLSIQKFTPNGAPLWNGGSQVIIYNPTPAGETPVRSIQNGYFPTMISDQAGGAVVNWYDNGTARNAWIQHILADGTLRFAGDGLPGSTLGGELRLSSAAGYNPDSGEYYLGFKTSNAAQSQWDYRAQRFNTDGTPLWGAGGTTLLPRTNVQSSFDAAFWTNGGFHIFLLENCCGSAGRLFGWRLSPDATAQWPAPHIVNSTLSSKSRLVADATPAGMSMVAWSAGDSQADILAQNVNLDGTLGPAPSCLADLSGSTNPDDPDYGIPDGIVDASDFFYYLDQFVAGNVAVADLTGASDPNDPDYGIPDGIVDASDFFYYLDIFVAGCP
ncbi:MAG: hypothetical protein KIT24_09440 [Phycisphaeraceae bacterium]|nr:hypothetical protein [Phycisphaeraceae bacterium]